jgi:uncharacterized membrane protein
VNLWPLLGIAVVVAGFALRLNALLVVVTAGVVTGLAAGMDAIRLLEVFGAGLLKSRILLIIVLMFPVIGLLERAGLREHAQAWIARLAAVTTGRLLLVYLAVRQLFAALGMTSIAGHAQTVRPLLAPMAQTAAEVRNGPLPERLRERVAALAAATDNVGLFFGEDVFIAFGAVLLMQTFLASNGIELEPWAIAKWGIPTALAAFAIHGTRLLRVDALLAREVAKLKAAAERAP